jgi:hypothetical protein
VVNELNDKHHLVHLLEWDSVQYTPSLFYNQPNARFNLWHVLLCCGSVYDSLGDKISEFFKLVIHQYCAHAPCE